MKARSPKFPSIVVVREKGGRIRWPAERRHRQQHSRDYLYYSLSHREKLLYREKPIGLSSVLPKAKDYPSLEHSGCQPGQGRRSSSKVSLALGRGSVPGVPWPPLVTSQGKVFPGMVSKKERGRGRFPGPPPPRTPQSSLVPAGGSRTRFSRGLPTAAELLGTGQLLKRSDCPRQLRPASPPTGPARHPYPVAHVSDKLKRPHIHSASMPASRFGSSFTKKKKSLLNPDAAS